jgi:tripartite-type tricarboxylate transporter receptor subunit TctC
MKARLAMQLQRSIAAPFVASLIVLWPANSLAQPIEQFYKGKTVIMVVPYDTGGGYDFYGRMVARHVGKHIPGQPTVITQNMPGAGSIKATNYIYSRAPKDGTVLGIPAQVVALNEALGIEGIQYKAAGFTWIGRVTSNVDVSLTWHASKAKTIQDVMTLETMVAGTGPGSSGTIYPQVMNTVTGTKFKIINGYKSASEMLLAMERGETDGAYTSLNTLQTSKQDWLEDKKVNILVQYTTERHPALSAVPTMIELGKTPEDKQVLALFASGAVIGRSILSTPDVPQDRTEALRKAFDSMLKDQAFLDEVEKTKAEFDPMSGAELQKVVTELSAIPLAVVEKARAAYAPAK